jgi:sulfate transport system permease protein
MSERTARRLLIAAVWLYIGLMLLVPIVTIFARALRDGVGPYLRAISEPDAVAAIALTLKASLIAVAANTVFGLAAAWAIARFRFRGRGLLLLLLDLPLMISPVVSGMLFIILFGMRGLFAPLLERSGLRVIFDTPGIVLATLFVTLPYVARELIAFMEAEGREEDDAAVSLGANGWHLFLRIVLPTIRWSLLYGVVLCSARAVGEFGAVSVVSGHIRGLTNTMTLHVEILYNEYQFTAAFAVASLLTAIGFLATAAKYLLARYGGSR